MSSGLVAGPDDNPAAAALFLTPYTRGLGSIPWLNPPRSIFLVVLSLCTHLLTSVVSKAHETATATGDLCPAHYATY